MSRMTVGIVLIVLGAMMLLWPSFSFTDRDEVADIGPIEVAVEDRETVSLPPILGGITIAAGLALMFTGRRPSHA